MSTLTRGVIGLCALGGVCGGGYGLHQLLSKDDIESKLKANGFTLLTDSTEHEEYWTDILKNYKLVAATESSLKFENFTGIDSSQQSDAKSKLQEFCKKAIEKRTFEDKQEIEYKRAKKWCVVPKTASEMLKAEGFKILDSKVKEDGAANPDDGTWKIKVGEYIKQGNQNKITNPSWEGGAEPTKADAEGIKKFMKQCEKLQNTKTHEQYYETILEDAKRWCSEEQNKS